MNYHIITIIFQTILGLACSLALEEMIDIQNRTKKWQRMVVWCVLFLVIAISRSFHMMAVCIATIPVLFCLYRIYAPIEKGTKAAVVVFSGAITSVLLTYIIERILNGKMLINSGKLDAAVACGVGASLGFIGIFLIMNLWNKHYARYHRLNNIWIFLLLFVNQLASMNRILHIQTADGLLPKLYIQFLFDWGIFLVLFNQVSKERVEKELQELNHYIEQEHLHYQEVEKEREEMAKLRHDYNNQLTAVLGLLHMNREKEAQAMLKEMKGE